MRRDQPLKPPKTGSKRAPAASTPKIASTPRVALSRERIEIEALALIDAHGIEAFSTRKLGQRLGCEAMSIYHHFASKAHVFDALVDRVLGGMYSGQNAQARGAAAAICGWLAAHRFAASALLSVAHATPVELRHGRSLYERNAGVFSRCRSVTGSRSAWISDFGLLRARRNS